VAAHHLQIRSEQASLTSLPAWQALSRHLALSSGPDVLFLITPDATAASYCRTYLEEAHPSEKGPLIHLEPDVANDPALIVTSLESVIAGSQHGLIWIQLPLDVPHEALRLAAAAWDCAFAALNPHRNHLLQALSRPLIFAGPPWMFQSFRSHAPDWFSIRSGVFDLVEDIARSSARSPQDNSWDPKSPSLATEPSFPIPEFPPDARPFSSELLVQALDALTPSQRMLLETLSWLNPEHPIPLWLLATHPALPSADSLPETLDSLVLKGLVNRSKDQQWLRLHPDVMAIVSHFIQDRDDHRASLGNALEMLEVADFGNPGKPSSWPRWVPAAPHVASVSFAAEKQESWAPAVSWLNRLGRLYISRANYEDAESPLRRALSIATAHLDPDGPLISMTQSNLAQLLHDTNRLTEAEPLMRDSLRIDRAAYGNDHPNVAIRLNNLALLLKDTNRLTEAEPLMREALRIDRDTFSDNHPDVAIDLNNLASLLQATNRLDQAEPLMREALRIDRAAFGDNQPDVAVDLNNLANLLQTTNRFAEAEPLMRDALRIDRAAFGGNHPNVAVDLNNLAQLLQATNRQAEAEPLMREALRIDRAAFGDDHPSVAGNLNNLAQLLQATNRLAEAEPLMREALQTDRAAYGNDHPNVARDLNNLAQLLQATNRLTEAEPLMREALRIDRAAYGDDHPEVAIDLNNMAGLLQAAKRPAEAELLFRDALRISQASLGPEHPQTATFARNLGLLLAEMKGDAG
jgi:tetratricopeptide (TPR) repeat protein